MRAVNLDTGRSARRIGAAAPAARKAARMRCSCCWPGWLISRCSTARARHEISSRPRAGRVAHRRRPSGPRPTRRAAGAVRELRGDARTACAGGLRARRIALRLGLRPARTRPRAPEGRVDHSLDGMVGSPAATPRARAHDGATSAVASATPPGSVPSVHAHRLRHEPVRGCPDAQPTAPDRRRQRRDAAELHARHSGERSAAAAADAAGTDPTFTVAVDFEPLPARVLDERRQRDIATATGGAG